MLSEILFAISAAFAAPSEVQLIPPQVVIRVNVPTDEPIVLWTEEFYLSEERKPNVISGQRLDIALGEGEPRDMHERCMSYGGSELYYWGDLERFAFLPNGENRRVWWECHRIDF